MKKTLAFSAFLLLLMPVMVAAQEVVADNINDFFGILCRILTYVFILFMIIAVFFILYAGWKYLTAGGEEEKIKDANRTLVYAIVAIVVAILARSVPFIVESLVGGGGVTGC